MGERLRKVPQMPAGARVELFGVEIQRAREAQQPLAVLPGGDHLADLHQGGHQPVGAHQEGALLPHQSIVGLLDPIPQDETVDRELRGDREDGGPHARIVRRQESQQWHEQQRGIQRLRVVALGEHPPLVETIRAHVGMDLVGNSGPTVRGLRIPAHRRQPPATVDGNPAHHFRGREVPQLPAHLPDAAIRLPPVFGCGVDQLDQHRPQALGEVVP